MSNKNLVLFFSYADECRRVASFLVGECDADVVSVKSRGFVFFKPLVHNWLFKKNKHIVLLPKSLDISKYENVFIGGPVWDGFPCPALQDLVLQLDLSGKDVFLFVVASSDFGIAVDKLKDLVKARGANIKGALSFFSSDSDEVVLEKVKDHLSGLE